MSDCKHCWHNTGTGYAQCDQQAGSSQVRCCHCGVYGSRRWTMKTRPVGGHGKYHSENVRVYHPSVEIFP